MSALGSMPPRADGPLLWRETTTVTYLEPLGLRAHPRLRCAFTTRHAGRSGQSLNLSFDKGERTAVLAHRQHVLQALDLEQTTLCTVCQVHGNQVCIVDAAMLQRGLTGIAADALVTNLRQVTLGVLIADCLPIVLYALGAGALALEVYAFVDALRHPEGSYLAAGKRTRTFWLVVLGVAMALGVVTLASLNFFALLGFVAAAVYLADVRPALRQVRGLGGRSDGW